MIAFIAQIAFFKSYEFRERMQEIYSKIHGIEISIPIDVQLTELLSKRINRTTLGKIIGDNNRYQYCVFDFWASWCQLRLSGFSAHKSLLNFVYYGQAKKAKTPQV